MDVCDIKVVCDTFQRNINGEIQEFDLYTITGQLSRSKFCTVYKIKNKSNESFILKEIDVDRLDNKDFEELFDLNNETSSDVIVSIESDAVKEINILNVRFTIKALSFTIHILFTISYQYFL